MATTQTNTLTQLVIEQRTYDSSTNRGKNVITTKRTTQLNPFIFKYSRLLP